MMPYSFDWYVEGQVIYAEIWGDQTIEELQASNAVIVEKLDQADNRLIHMIMNDEKLVSTPTNLFQLQKVLTYTKHPNLGWAVVIGEKEQSLKDSTQDFIILMLAKLTRARFIRLKTLEEAVNHLQKVDQSIDWDAVNPNYERTF